MLLIRKHLLNRNKNADTRKGTRNRHIKTTPADRRKVFHVDLFAAWLEVRTGVPFLLCYAMTVYQHPVRLSRPKTDFSCH